MAMLAEKRQKVRWVLNPRETAWSKDSNKFGQQYMEKLGWKAGQGIGANLQGCTEHVKVSVRSDNRGVGFKDIPEDVLPHQNNFSDLLAQLASNNPPAITKPDERKSLELKSRQSRARVHYHKFTRGKDLSRYSQNDLACILGKTENTTKIPVEDSVENEPNFIHRGSMNAYFKEKSKSSSINLLAKEDKCKEEEEDSLYIGFGFSQVVKDVPTLCSISENYDSKEELDESVKLSRKKHKGNYQRLENGQEVNESGKDSNRKRKKNAQDVDSPENCFAQTDFRETIYPVTEGELDENIKKSKKKRKKVDQSGEVLESETCLPLTDNSEISVVRPIDNDEELNENIKKSKKKRRKVDQSVEVLESETCLPLTDSSEISVVRPIDNVEELNETSKKSKKKRKNDQCMETDFSETVDLPLVGGEKESHASRSNKKRDKALLSSNRNDLENKTIDDKTSNNQPKHRKKKFKGNETIGSQSIDNDFMQSEKAIKSVRFSDPLLSVFLIPSRDQLQSNHIRFDNNEPESCDISVDLKVKKGNQAEKSPVKQDQPSNLAKVASKPIPCEISKTCHQLTLSPENIAKCNKIVVDGITYTNGISEHNRCLPRRQKYAFGAPKHIYRDLRPDAFDQFPGSNVETLGYGPSP